MKSSSVSMPDGVARQRWRCERKASVLAGRERRAALRCVAAARRLGLAPAGFFLSVGEDEASGPEGIGSPVGKSMGFSAAEGVGSDMFAGTCLDLGWVGFGFCGGRSEPNEARKGRVLVAKSAKGASRSSAGRKSGQQPQAWLLCRGKINAGK